MSYKERYLALKNEIANNYLVGPTPMNPMLVNQLSNLAFVVGDQVLGDDINATILSLIEEFNRIATINLKHNLELLQYYAVGRNLMTGVSQCENCEIVLRYIDNTICLSNSWPRSGYGTDFDCSVSQGMIRFYIRQRNGDMYKYTNINVVKINIVNSLDPFMNRVYQNNDEMIKLNDSIGIALSKGQSDAMLESAKSGRLEVSTPSDIKHSTSAANTIFSRAKKASGKSQLNKLTNQRALSLVPSQTAINSANIVANSIMKTKSANDLSAILIPGNDPIAINTNNSIQTVSGIIGGNGINISNNDKSTSITSNTSTTLNTNVNNRASIAVDANLAVIPSKEIVNDKNIKIAPNNISSYINDLKNQAENIYEDVSKEAQSLSDKVINFFTGKTTITPVSENLSVMTNGLPNSNNTINIPANSNIPNQNITHTMPLSQKTALRRFNNIISAANRNALVPIDQQSRLAAIIKNGEANLNLNTNASSNPNFDVGANDKIGIDMETLSLDQLIKKYTLPSTENEVASDKPIANLINENINENISVASATDNSDFSLATLKSNNRRGNNFYYSHSV